jgi:hypothetical protein
VRQSKATSFYVARVCVLTVHCPFSFQKHEQCCGHRCVDCCPHSDTHGTQFLAYSLSFQSLSLLSHTYSLTTFALVHLFVGLIRQSEDEEFAAVASKYPLFKKLSLAKWRDVPEANAKSAMAKIDDLDDVSTLNRLWKSSGLCLCLFLCPVRCICDSLLTF